MQKRYSYFLFILFAFVLVVSIIFAQKLTNQATTALQNGNIEAVETFKTNNAMQQLVNLSFTLQSRLTRINSTDTAALNILEDSLTVLGYNANVLNNVVSRKGTVPDMAQLMTAVNRQLDLSYAVVDAGQKKQTGLLAEGIDSLKKYKPEEAVYHYGVQVEAFLEKHLQQTLVTNAEHSDKLSVYNRILAIAVVIVVLIFTTIIILRQWQQRMLIKELSIAREVAVKSKNAKDEFLANMSHELRTPLNSLIGFGNLLADTPLNNQQKEYTNTIVSNGYNLLHLVNDVLDFSSIEAGKLSIKNVPFNLQDLFRDLEHMFAAIIAEKKLFFKWTIDAQTPKGLRGDPQRLKQVLVNLINNAVKFTTRGGVMVRVEVVSYEATGSYRLSFMVNDSGEGIPEEKLHLIFDRFEQLEHATIRQHGGTGLGLSIVRSIVERMGGSVAVKSKPGQGAEFTFTGIFEKDAAAEKTIAKEKRTIAADFTGFTALVVEDNRANRQLMKYLLGKYKLGIDLAENGKEAVEKAAARAYDIIIMDIQMPQMDGYSAIIAMREELRLSTPAIAMTAYVMENEVRRCFESGFDDYISKPVQEHDVIAMILKYLRPSSESASMDFFMEQTQGDTAIMQELLAEIKKQWGTDKLELQASVRTGDMEEAGRVLHRTRSTFALLGPQHIIQTLLNSNTITAGGGTDVVEACNRVINRIDEEINFIFQSN
ncbi:MAG: response regulator [Niabella sp.]|nr:response regulator [Niabella sp.]